MTQNQNDIITDLVIDNGLIFNEMKIWTTICDPQANARAKSVVKYCHTLFMETVCDQTFDDKDYVQTRLADLIVAILKYRKQYEVGTNCYKLFNSLFDKTVEALSEFNEIEFNETEFNETI